MGHEATYAVQQIAAYSITSSAVASSVCGMLRPSTLDAVAERAGISKGGLVYSFATKDGLVRAALEREVTRFQGAVRQRRSAASTFWIYGRFQKGEARRSGPGSVALTI
jgi:hypothetical protein